MVKIKRTKRQMVDKTLCDKTLYVRYAPSQNFRKPNNFKGSLQ